MPLKIKKHVDSKESENLAELQSKKLRCKEIIGKQGFQCDKNRLIESITETFSKKRPLKTYLRNLKSQRQQKGWYKIIPGTTTFNNLASTQKSYSEHL